MYMKKFVQLYNLNPKGLLHVGAHTAEEFPEYWSNGFADSNPIIWVEAQPNLVAELRKKLDPSNNKIYEAVAWNESGVELTFKVTSKTASSSLFELGEHMTIYPEINVESTLVVTTRRLDEVLDPEDQFDFVVLDIQGAEYQAIEGLGAHMQHVNWVYTEVSQNALYKGASLFKDIEELMARNGFKRIFLAWDRRAGWGDALYVRKSIHNVTSKQIILDKINNLNMLIRGYIPNQLFPLLVKIKKWLK